MNNSSVTLFYAEKFDTLKFSSLSSSRRIIRLWYKNGHSKKVNCVFECKFYSLAARLQDNSRPKSPTKVETKRKLQQFTVSGWLIMNGEESGNERKENVKVEITFNMKRQYNYQPLFA